MAEPAWWKTFLKRIKFPTTGHFLIVPDDDPGEVVLMHGETRMSIPISMDETETLSSVADMFQELIPDGKVAAPSGTSDAGAWWLSRIGERKVK